jgi:cytosolic phospholipase A2
MPSKVAGSYGNTVETPAPICHHECAIVFMPVLPNERAVQNFNPSIAKFSGPYSLIWTPEQIEMLVQASIANFNEREETIKTALKDALMRRKALRERHGVGAEIPKLETQLKVFR